MTPHDPFASPPGPEAGAKLAKIAAELRAMVESRKASA